MIGNFSAGVSGLENAQRGLQVTGQNLTNVNTEGYTRRRVEYVDTHYSKIGFRGKDILQVGSGVDVSCLRQIRDTLLDQSYRNENSRMNYYTKEYEILNEIETLLIDSTDFSSTLDELYGAISTLSQNPDSVSARAGLIESAENFIYEAKFISNKLDDLQGTINEQIRVEVDKANGLLEEIYILNEEISKFEISGDEASDLRDQRNAALDKLSAIIPITVTEKADSKVQVYADGRDLYGTGTFETMSIKSTGGVDGFITPIWTKAGDEIVNMNKPLNPDANYQDGGTLKALMMARGNVDATYATDSKDVALYTIPTVKQDFDKLINAVVTKINETFAPKSHVDGPYSADGSQYIELFSRISVDRYKQDENGNYIYNAENPNDYYSLYTIDNIEVNKEVLNDNNYSKLCVSRSGDVGDNTLLQDLLSDWKDKNITNDVGTTMNFESYLVYFLSDVATTAGTSKSNLEHQTTLVEATESERQSTAGVSLDEELSTLIRFQQSYSASSRVLQTIDSMIETLILSMAV